MSAGRRLPVALLFLPGAPLAAQAAMAGIVRADSSNKPLPGVQVLIEGSTRQTFTDATGRYRLDAPPGRQIALFRSIGYRPVRVRLQLSKGDTLHADALMVRDLAQQLDPVVTAGEPGGAGGLGLEAFESRRHAGFGRFIDSAELRRSDHLEVADMLRRVGVWVVRFQECELIRPRVSRCGPVELRAASSRRGTMDGSGCWMQVIVDGVVVYRAVPPGFPTVDRPPDFARDFGVSDLQAVEVYRSSAETPIEFGQGGAPCGAIVLWSRRGMWKPK
jgi:carboxypeptidase-like protein